MTQHDRRTLVKDERLLVHDENISDIVPCSDDFNH